MCSDMLTPLEESTSCIPLGGPARAAADGMKRRLRSGGSELNLRLPRWCGHVVEDRAGWTKRPDRVLVVDETGSSRRPSGPRKWPGRTRGTTSCIKHSLIKNCQIQECPGSATPADGRS